MTGTVRHFRRQSVSKVERAYRGFLAKVVPEYVAFWEQFVCYTPANNIDDRSLCVTSDPTENHRLKIIQQLSHAVISQFVAARRSHERFRSLSRTFRLTDRTSKRHVDYWLFFDGVFHQLGASFQNALNMIVLTGSSGKSSKPLYGKTLHGAVKRVKPSSRLMELKSTVQSNIIDPWRNWLAHMPRVPLKYNADQDSIRLPRLETTSKRNAWLTWGQMLKDIDLNWQEVDLLCSSSIETYEEFLRALFEFVSKRLEEKLAGHKVAFEPVASGSLEPLKPTIIHPGSANHVRFKAPPQH